MARRKHEAHDLKVTVKIDYVKNPSPEQLAAWRQLWGMLLRDVHTEQSPTSTKTGQTRGKYLATWKRRT